LILGNDGFRVARGMRVLEKFGVEVGLKLKKKSPNPRKEGDLKKVRQESL
jgi:hypothetical protein